MLPSPNCYKLIQRFEGFRPTAYKDAGGTWTIGWGHTHGAKVGDTCTHDQGQTWLEDDVHAAVLAINVDVGVTLTQNQFDALVSLVFNIGAGAFRASTLLQKLNQRDFAMAAAEFTRWNKSGGRHLAGLLDRRLAEQQLFNTP